jgi:hypothetical protein
VDARQRGWHDYLAGIGVLIVVIIILAIKRRRT